MCTSYHGMADDAREGSVLPLFQFFIGTVQKILQAAGFRLVFAYSPELHLRTVTRSIALPEWYMESKAE